MPLDTAAIVLAGGKSTRFGRDKAAEPLLGVPMLQRVVDLTEGLVDEVIIVGRPGQDLAWVRTERPSRAVEDLYPGAGPAGALYTGLTASQAPVALAVACDMPLLQLALLAALLQLGRDHDLVVPVCDGLPQPLCAVYRTSCRERLRAELEAGDLKLVSIIDKLSAHYVEEKEWHAFDPGGLSFANLNSEADLRRAEALLSA
jgi:molybdopterin-guanine dinucleotide biosynthesis protein A